MAKERTSTPNQTPRPRPQPRPRQPGALGGTTGIILGVAAIVIAIAAGVYAWMNNSDHEQETAALRSKVKFLENRVNNTENAIVQISAGEEIIPADRSDDANVVINNTASQKSGKDAAVHSAAKTKQPASRAKKTTSAKTKTKVSAKQSQTAKRPSRRATSSGSRVPSTFGTTYSPPSNVHYAVLIDSFKELRQAEITKASLAVRYGAYIRKVGNVYNVYAGWYTDANDARQTLRLLSSEYGPSCRVATIYK